MVYGGLIPRPHGRWPGNEAKYEVELAVQGQKEREIEIEINVSCQLLTSLALVNDPKTVLYSCVLEPLSCAAGRDKRSCQRACDSLSNG